MSDDRRSEIGRDRFERQTFGLSHDGEEYQVPSGVRSACRPLRLKRYVVLKSAWGENPRLVGVFMSFEEAAEEANEAEGKGDRVTIETVDIRPSMEEVGRSVRDRMREPQSMETPEHDESEIRPGLVDVFRREVSNGVVAVGERYRWLCACGAQGSELHESEEKAKNLLWKHRSSDRCEIGTEVGRELSTGTEELLEEIDA